MIPAKLPGPATDEARTALGARWVRAQTLLLFAYLVLPGFVSAVVVSLVVFGLSWRTDSLLALTFVSGAPLVAYVVVAVKSRKADFWLRPENWVSRAGWLGFAVGFALLPATGYWSPNLPWVWPMSSLLCVATPILTLLLAKRARTVFLTPVVAELGETAFVVKAETTGSQGELRLTATELRWRTGTGEHAPEETLLLKRVQDVKVVHVERTRPPRRAFGKANGTGGIPLAPGPVLAVHDVRGTVLFPVTEPEVFADLVRRRQAARTRLLADYS
ncbi:putative membrane protein [Crossiella equi]|uniref:Membrane protein n=1 Tax=Crossiella equi TaxID=130796 RepID=A0ABS5AAP1_9PSEU|nr:hypothetical protein [Crossiella equi]MBP2473643.1 putative membrane protein [Crossiella equi]